MVENIVSDVLLLNKGICFVKLVDLVRYLLGYLIYV